LRCETKPERGKKGLTQISWRNFRKTEWNVKI
jgi:hypothetical protein